MEHPITDDGDEGGGWPAAGAGGSARGADAGGPSLLPMAAALAILALSGAGGALWAGRPGAARGAVPTVDPGRVPLVLGPWHGRELALDRGQLAVGEIDGCLLRLYVRRGDGAAVRALLVSGRPGPIALHPPTVCYAGAGFEPSRPRRRAIAIVPGAAPEEFWVADFRKPDAAEPEHLRIFWAWGVDGSWTAPDHPRLQFATAPALHKLYLIGEGGGPGGARDDDPCLDLARWLLPALKAALAPGSPPPGLDSGPHDASRAGPQRDRRPR